MKIGMLLPPEYDLEAESFVVFRGNFDEPQRWHELYHWEFYGGLAAVIIALDRSGRTRLFHPSPDVIISFRAVASDLGVIGDAVPRYRRDGVIQSANRWQQNFRTQNGTDDGRFFGQILESGALSDGGKVESSLQLPARAFEGESGQFTRLIVPTGRFAMWRTVRLRSRSPE